MGSVILRRQGSSIEKQACAYAAAGSDARMSGCEKPVIILSGSGNQGITASVPVVVVAQALGTSEELFFGGTGLPGEDCHGNAGGDALVAGAGYDHDRLLAAGHTGIGARRRIGRRLLAQKLALPVQQHRADVGTPVAPDTLPGNGHIIFNLLTHRFGANL